MGEGPLRRLVRRGPAGDKRVPSRLDVCRGKPGRVELEPGPGFQASRSSTNTRGSGARPSVRVLALRVVGGGSVPRVFCPTPAYDVEELSADADAKRRFAVLERHQARSDGDRVRPQHALARHLSRRGGEPPGGGIRTAGNARPERSRDARGFTKNRGGGGARGGGRGGSRREGRGDVRVAPRAAAREGDARRFQGEGGTGAPVRVARTSRRRVRRRRRQPPRGRPRHMQTARRRRRRRARFIVVVVVEEEEEEEEDETRAKPSSKKFEEVSQPRPVHPLSSTKSTSPTSSSTPTHTARRSLALYLALMSTRASSRYPRVESPPPAAAAEASFGRTAAAPTTTRSTIAVHVTPLPLNAVVAATTALAAV
mmetsp:Transcript_3043/g.13590  ORF Transcript_3043/g.13590 Transcript_3043/m.13590 type:complete len:369 (+) Transcript_3043:2182-3288(+)